MITMTQMNSEKFLNATYSASGLTFKYLLKDFFKLISKKGGQNGRQYQTTN
jgi:hypothetical protein